MMLRSLDVREVMRESAPIHRDVLFAIKEQYGERASTLIGEHIRFAS